MDGNQKDQMVPRYKNDHVLAVLKIQNHVFLCTFTDVLFLKEIKIIFTLQILLGPPFILSFAAVLPQIIVRIQREPSDNGAASVFVIK